MNLQSLASIAEIIGAFGVILTLIFLVVSIRQNTMSQKAVAVDSLAAAIATINVPAIESPKVGSAVSKAALNWSAASRDERIIAHYFLFSYFKLSENAWYQRKAKVLDQEQWYGWEMALLKYYHSAGIQEVWWPRRRNAYSKEFQRFLSMSSPPEDLGSLSDIFEYDPEDA